MTMHIFNVDDAVEHGMEKAVILQNMRFWLDKNKANGTNLHDGYYWTYNSAEAFFTLFPYFKSAKVIQRLLKSMVAEGLLISGNYNKKGYDRTKWYSMPEYCAESLDTSHCSKMTNGLDKNDQCNGQECPMDCSKMTNAMVTNDQPIPDVNADSKPDVNADSKPDVNADSKPDVNADLSTKKKIPKKPVKKLTDYPSDFKPTDKQVDKMNEYGINIDLTLETFKSTHQSNGKQFKDWNAALTTWINKKIEWDKLIPVPAQEEYEPAFNGWNDRNPDYNPPSQQPDVYHPSQAEFQPVEPVTYVPAMNDPNWRWTEPLPGMSIIETDRYIKENKFRGENPNRTYQRLLSGMQGETV